MKKIAIVCAATALLMGCQTALQSPHVSPVSPVITNTAPKPELWVPIYDGSRISYNQNYKYHPSEMKLSNGMLLRGEKWDGFLRRHILSLPEIKRDDVLDGLSRMYIKYDRVDDAIKFEPLRFIDHPYSQSSYVSAVGSIKNGKMHAFLKIKYYGESWLFADSITVVGDNGYKWKSGKLKFYRDNYTKVWEYTYLPLSKPENRVIADNIATSNAPIVRFHGSQYYDDLVVNERMTDDLRAFLTAYDALNGK